MKKDENGLSLEPQQCEGFWYYEEKKGLEVIAREKNGDYMHLTIPWRKVAASFKRKYPKEFISTL